MITLIHDLIIYVDANNYTLMLDKHKQDKKGNPIYETLGYYGTLTSAVYGAKEYCIRKQLGSDTYMLDHAIKLIKQINKDFLSLLEGVMQ